MLDSRYLRNVPLPPDLTHQQLFKAMYETQEFFKNIRVSSGVILSKIIQANNFSGVVSNVFTQMLSDNSGYKSFHDQKYPDLKHESHFTGLEVKATNKAMKGGEGHNGHSGWHIIVCYTILPSYDIEIIQLELADLIGYEHGILSDWKYQGSSRNENNSQRTETYITTNVGTAKLRDGSAYINTEYISLKSLTTHRKKVPLEIPNFSPFY